MPIRERLQQHADVAHPEIQDVLGLEQFAMSHATWQEQDHSGILAPAHVRKEKLPGDPRLLKMADEGPRTRAPKKKGLA